MKNAKLGISIFPCVRLCVIIIPIINVVKACSEPSPTCLMTTSLPVDSSGNLNYRAMPSIGNGYIGTVIMSDEIHVSGLFNGRANVEKSNKKDFKQNKQQEHKHTHASKVTFTDNDDLQGHETFKVKSNINKDAFTKHPHKMHKDGTTEYFEEKNKESLRKREEGFRKEHQRSNGKFTAYKHNKNQQEKDKGPTTSTEHTHRARIPSSAAINFTVNVDGERLYALDMAEGVFYQWFVSQAGIYISQRVYCHRTRKNLIVNEIFVQSTINQIIMLSSNHGPYSRDINFLKFHDDSYNVMFGQINQTETEQSPNISVAVVWTPIPTYIEVGASEAVQTFTFLTAIVTSLETNDSVGLGMEHHRRASHSEDLFDEHTTAWKNIWADGNITLTSKNLHLPQTIFSSLYNIYSSVRSDWIYGLSPGSLSTSYEYLGHTFWDQDIWMFPPILMFNPEIANSLIQYRFNRLEKATEIAKSYKYQGAMYPWESALSGSEVCPEKVYGKYEIHVTGDIAHAVNQYFLATQDVDWLKTYGFHIVYQTALFWSSRITYNVSRKVYCINDVMPPDEYHYPVNNSVYTNVIAKSNLEYAVKFATVLGESIPNEWQEIADNMYIPFDTTLQYHPEYEGFNISDPKSKVKQADTILINFPLLYKMKGTIKRNDLSMYSKITDPNGPAMTHSMFTIGWLDVNETQSANLAFAKNFENIQEPFKIWDEVKGGKGESNFITAAGGFLQALLFGYGGLRIRDSCLEYDMKLLNETVEYSLNGIKYLGNSLLLQRMQSSCLIRLLIESKKNESLCVHINDSYTQLTNKSLEISCKGVIKMCMT